MVIWENFGGYVVELICSYFFIIFILFEKYNGILCFYLKIVLMLFGGLDRVKWR